MAIQVARAATAFRTLRSAWYHEFIQPLLKYDRGLPPEEAQAASDRERGTRVKYNDQTEAILRGESPGLYPITPESVEQINELPPTEAEMKRRRKRDEKYLRRAALVDAVRGM